MMTKSEIELEKELLLISQEEAAERLLQLEAEQAKIAKTEKEELRKRKLSLLDDARNYEALARDAKTKEDTDQKLDWAKASRDEAAKIVIEGETFEEELPKVEQIANKRKLSRFIAKYMPFIQVGVLVSMIVALLMSFYGYQAKIERANSLLSEDELITKKVNAFNDSNLQRIVFERLLQSTDLVFILIFLLIIAPSVLCYQLPFVKSNKDFYHDFFYKLTAWERIKFVAMLFGSLLIYFGLSHSVNQF
ncbi:hypothetical protein SAMN04515674_101518 [Pseudarcicella hirudinis]|uniref:Uncharacterized protein n=1 Tax=Pseudarcicella hirudinis TaxID=1079859 RepID=A0A1I5MZ79_9BACT|nr:hypothetical protein [Pseudarcicella hirudinis]SFP14759.1 hypothetical protein SAMN04515674_101518 [Pseudarcicella hirudinis]